MSTSNWIQEAQRTISDPSFDVMEFIKHLNTHYENEYVVRTLIKDPSILLAIVEMGESEFIVQKPMFLEEKAFLEINDKENEVWHKKTTAGNWWYGVVVRKDLCIHVRYVSSKSYENAHEFEVYTPKNWENKTFKPDEEGDIDIRPEMRKMWRRLKMKQKGIAEKPKKARKDPVDGPVWDVRKKFKEFFDVSFPGMIVPTYAGGSNHSPITSGPDYYLNASIKMPGQQWRHTYWRLHFRILASGKKNIRVYVEAAKDQILYPEPEEGYEKVRRWGNDVTIGKIFPADEKDLSLKIVDWVIHSTKDGLEIKNRKCPELDGLLKQLVI